MSKISLVDLEVFYSIGVADEERAQPQRLLVTVDMSYDFSVAAVSDRIEKTINYHDLANDLLTFGANRSWKLLEKLASNIADHIMAKYRPLAVKVEVKKFVIPKANHVSVTVTRPAKG
jgi:FolB domain-containing protein